MKKWISLLLLFAALSALWGASALAEEGSLRHEITGDVSHFQVSQGVDRAQGYLPGPTDTIGTDIYLFVDPDTASYVTFYVTDERGNPIPGARIYLSYDGVEEFYGVTDENGMLSTYLFRDVEYGYRVTKGGYETAIGTFTATRETKLVHIVLRRLYNLTIYVVNDGVPMPGVTVIIDGKSYVTDAEGKVTVRRPNGEYNVTVIAPDGRRINLLAIVNGDTTIVVDLAKDGAIMDGLLYQDRFLVYNKFYNPEDYELTFFDFKAEDLAKFEDETDEEFALRTARYLDKYTRTVLIEAQPERQQLKNGTDKDKYNPDGTPLYAQRSLMPMGMLLKNWEEMGYTDLVFTNENFGIRLDMNALHTGDMAKVYAMLDAIERGEHARSIVRPEHSRHADVARMNRLTLDTLEVDKLNLDIIDDFIFDFDLMRVSRGDAEMRSRPRLSDTLYTNTLFEFRITPILPEALRSMIRDGLAGDPAMPKDSLMLASPGYFSEELRRWRADGRLTEGECDELFAYVVDGMLTADELEDLRDKVKYGILTYDDVQQLLYASVQEKAYRLSCWIIYDEAKINVTELMDGMVSLWKVDELFELEFAQQMKFPEADEKTAVKAAEAAMEDMYDLLTVDNLGKLRSDKDYTPGDNTASLDMALICSKPEESDEFYAITHDRWFDSITVDVRKENIELGGKHENWYRAYFTYDMTQLGCRRALAAHNETCGLAVLVYDR